MLFQNYDIPTLLPELIHELSEFLKKGLMFVNNPYFASNFIWRSSTLEIRRSQVKTTRANLEIGKSFRIYKISSIYVHITERHSMSFMKNEKKLPFFLRRQDRRILNARNRRLMDRWWKPDIKLEFFLINMLIIIISMITSIITTTITIIIIMIIIIIIRKLIAFIVSIGFLLLCLGIALLALYIFYQVVGRGLFFM